MKLNFYVKVTQTERDIIVAICDEELLGKKLTDRKRDLCFKVSELFYKGSKMDLDSSIQYMKNASIANLIGSRIVKRAIEAKLIHPTAIVHIAGVPHAQIVKMHR